MNHERISQMLLLCASFVLASSALAQSEDPTPFTSPVPLTLINGWESASGVYDWGTSIAEVAIIDGVVHFKGGIETSFSNTNSEPFVLPPGFRPAHWVYIPVDMNGADKGRLIIQPNGVVNVDAETSFSNAQGLTSLDGASFALGGRRFTTLTLINGWTNAPFSTSNAQAANIDGIVHFKGAIATSGTNSEPFVLPAAFRPAHWVYVPVDLCRATNGRLIIAPDGVVNVQAETSFSDAQCFTSLDGASFALGGTGRGGGGFTALTLINGWTNYGFGTSNAEVVNIDGVVHFKGAIASGTYLGPFVLPAAFRPATNVYIHLDMCEATNGRITISPSGATALQSERDAGDEQCFTSLDGASFVK